MKNKYFLFLLLGLFGLVGCSAVPKPINREFTNQETLEASEHWEILAQDFAKQISTMIEKKPLQSSSSEEAGIGYINESNQAVGGNEKIVNLPYIYLQTNDVSNFGRTFRSYIITELSKLGYPIAHSPEGALLARWSVRKVYHDADRIASGFPLTGTASALLGYGVYKIIDDSSSAFAGVLAGGVVYDVLNGGGEYLFPGKVPNTEIVLTFTVSKYETILSRQTQAYYVNAEDFDHYHNIADYAGQEISLNPVHFKLTNQ